MTENYVPQVGDRVRVVMEFDATADGSDCICTNGGPVALEYLDSPIVVSVEKIEPPVEVFKPGDRLRRLEGWNYEITLGDEGFFQHFNTGKVSFYRYDGSSGAKSFTSERYELVTR